jgi:hypothetical protein
MTVITRLATDRKGTETFAARMAAMETFVVRVWLPSQVGPTEASGLTTLRGVLEHVASGKSSAFAGTIELEGLILAALRAKGQSEDLSPAASWRDPRQA